MHSVPYAILEFTSKMQIKGNDKIVYWDPETPENVDIEQQSISLIPIRETRDIDQISDLVFGLNSLDFSLWR